MKLNTSRQHNKSVWVEKYRPTCIKDIILPLKYKRFFNKIVKDGEVPNLLLHSINPGSGKTSIAKALCEEMNVEWMYINISLDNGIDTLRTQIQNFASMMSFDGKPKVVIMDEFCGASEQLQKALRGFIEEYAQQCRFIITCNYLQKIIKPIRKGRCQVFSFDMSNKEWTKGMLSKVDERVRWILDQEGVGYDENTVAQLVFQEYPDIRNVIALLEQYAKMNEYIDVNIFNVTRVDKQLYTMIMSRDFPAARKFILDNAYAYENLYTAFYNELVPMYDGGVRAQAYILLATYQYQHAFVANPEINFAALLCELMQLGA